MTQDDSKIPKIVSGLKHRRKIPNLKFKDIEMIKYVVLEGSSITLVGLFEYDL